MAANYQTDEAIKNAKGDSAYLAEFKQGVVPDVLNDDGLEENVFGLMAKYPSVSTLLGNELTPLLTKTVPIVDWQSEDNKFYTLLMTDPDAPSRADPTFREVEHWLVVNIPKNEVQKGECLTEYIGPGPPKGTGLHRYIFLLFVQPDGKINFSEPYKGAEEINSRLGFNTRDFVKKYNLGKAIAGNYYISQWDESVRARKK